MEQVITVNQLVKRFGTFTAVDHISFHVNRGEIFGFLGANGAGKTTAMRILCGLSKATEGEGQVAGHDITREPEKIKREIGYMSQKFSLYENLTVRENIRLYGGIYGLSRPEIRGKMNLVLQELDLVEEKSSKVMNSYIEAVKSRLAPFTDFPIIFTSALTKQRILKVLEAAKDVFNARTTRISTSKLNEELLPLIEAYPPPSNKGKYIKIKYITQLPNTRVPSFVFFANLPQYVKEPYKRFLENKMRERWKLSGTPINIFIRQK